MAFINASSARVQELDEKVRVLEAVRDSYRVEIDLLREEIATLREELNQEKDSRILWDDLLPPGT